MKKTKANYKAQDNSNSTVQEPLMAYLATPSHMPFWASLGIHTNLDSDYDALTLIKAGLKKTILNETMSKLGFTLEEMADILHTTDRTLRRYTSSTVLNAEQSERLIELAKLYAYGAEVLGSLEACKRWMNEPLQAFNFQKPKNFLDSSIGIRLLHNALGRLEYGVYA